MRQWIVLGATAMLLASCGGKGPTPAQSPSASASGAAQSDHASVNYSDNTPASSASTPEADNVAAMVSADLPFGFTRYPGAKVVTASKINLSHGSGKLVVMSTSDSPAKVIKFYEHQARAAGITIRRQTSTGGMKVVGGDRPDGVAFVISASPGPSGTTAQLVVGKGVS